MSCLITIHVSKVLKQHMPLLYIVGRVAVRRFRPQPSALLLSSS